jgi:tetraacyldisaccharide 4'-kinase
MRFGPVLSRLEFLEVVSGRRRGAAASICRAALACLEPAYRLAIAWRNRRYSRGSSAVHKVPVPVISVGNITAGGTGKTPAVAWMARWFRQKGVRVTLISRGYGATAGACNDEALELEQLLPDVPHLLNPDRVAAAMTAIEEFECQLLILDDAFQHRRIHRDLDIVLIDALEPFGYGHLLPRGLLREPASSLARAHVVALTRCDLAEAADKRRILDTVARFAPDATVVELAHRPKSWMAWPDLQLPLNSLAGTPVIAFCGIGNPDGFRRALHTLDCKVAGFRAFADHHPYDRTDLESLAEWARGLRAEAIVCTQKDLVKIQAPRLGDLPVYSLCGGIEVLTGDGLETRLSQLAAIALSREPAV